VPINSASFLIWALQDVRDRHLRFIAALDELRRTSEPGERVFLRTARERMTDRLANFDKQLVATLQGAVAEDDPDPSTWSLLRPKLAELGRVAFQQFSITQQELYPFLPLSRRVPSDIGFFLARASGLEPTLPAHRELFTLSYGKFTIWEGGLFERPAERVATIPIPFTEALTALRWPLLIHELAHWYLPGGRPLAPPATDALHAEFGGVSARVKAIFNEVFADLVAFRACGLPYILALALEAYLSSSQRSPLPNGILPSALARLRLLVAGTMDQILDAIPIEWEIDKGSSVPPGILSRITAVAERLLVSFPSSKTNPDVVTRARILLAHRGSACAVHRFETIRPGDLLTLDAGVEADLQSAVARRVFGAPVDYPCQDSEILEAAWLVQLDREPSSILAELRAQVGSQDKPASSVATTDTAVSRSLQAAAVHRWLLTWDKATRGSLPRIPRRRQSTDAPLAQAALDPEGWTEDSPLADIQLVRRMCLMDSRALVIRPLIDSNQVGGTTVDLRLGTEWEILRTARFQALNPGDDPEDVGELLAASVEDYRLTIGHGQNLVLHPGELLLALTLEYLSLPDDLWGNLEGRSTWARLGLQVHATAGMVDCGFEGYLTLELQNTGRIPLVLSPGLRIAQMAFFPVRGVMRPYHGKPSAAYSAQTSARTAFHRQHEHAALNRFLAKSRRPRQWES